MREAVGLFGDADVHVAPRSHHAARAVRALLVLLMAGRLAVRSWRRERRRAGGLQLLLSGARDQDDEHQKDDAWCSHAHGPVTRPRSITEHADWEWVTYAKRPSGVMAIARGSMDTLTCPLTLCVRVSTTSRRDVP